MTLEMKEVRDSILKDTVELMVANDKFKLNLSISKAIYAKNYQTLLANIKQELLAGDSNDN